MQLTGIGLYTFPEAARLTGVPSAQLRRWLIGYKGPNGRAHPPLWETDLEPLDIEGLSFHDLLEVRLVAHFRNLGISLQTIRVASMHARDLFNSSHPFICQRFLTDGRSIFAEAMEESDDRSLIDLKSKQYVIEKVVRRSLYAGLEYQNERPQRWFPVGGSRTVVLDPERAFGKPILREERIRTDILFDAWKAEGQDHQRVAHLYDVPTHSLKAAIRYEESLAA